MNRILYIGLDPAALEADQALVALWRRQAARHMRCPVCGAVAQLDGELKVGEVTIATFEHEAFCPVGQMP